MVCGPCLLLVPPLTVGLFPLWCVTSDSRVLFLLLVTDRKLNCALLPDAKKIQRSLAAVNDTVAETAFGLWIRKQHSLNKERVGIYISSVMMIHQVL